MTKQIQKGGNQSTNVQAENVTIVQGITLSEAREIALDVFKANFYSLAGQAADIARKRAEEMTDKFLEKLQEQNLTGLQQAVDPDFQYAIYTAQKEYARTGDKELGDLLVDLLVDRTKQESRSVLQIVLNESLSTAPKLTVDQLASLSLIFLIRYTVNNGINNLESFFNYLDKYIQPFVKLISKKPSCYQHLVFCGCGEIGIGSVNIPDIFRNSYSGLFSKGFELEELSRRSIILPAESDLLVDCLNDKSKLQINAMRAEFLREKVLSLGLPPPLPDQLAGLLEGFLMNQNEVREYLKSIRPYMNTLIDIWEGSMMQNVTLTSVGIAIGHANVKKNLGEFTDLSIWIN